MLVSKTFYLLKCYTAPSHSSSCTCMQERSKPIFSSQFGAVALLFVQITINILTMWDSMAETRLEFVFDPPEK